MKVSLVLGFDSYGNAYYCAYDDENDSRLNNEFHLPEEIEIDLEVTPRKRKAQDEQA